VHYKLKKVNFITYNDNNNNSIINKSYESQTFLKLIRYIIFLFKFHSFIESP